MAEEFAEKKGALSKEEEERIRNLIGSISSDKKALPPAPAPDPAADFPAPDPAAEFPPPAQGSDFPAPAQGSDFPAPDPAAEFPPPAQGSDFPAPDPAAEFPPPAQESGAFPPAANPNLAQGTEFPAPSPESAPGFPAPEPTSEFPPPAQGSDFPAPGPDPDFSEPANTFSPPSQKQDFPNPEPVVESPPSAQGSGFPDSAPSAVHEPGFSPPGSESNLSPLPSETTSSEIPMSSEFSPDTQPGPPMPDSSPDFSPSFDEDISSFPPPQGAGPIGSESLGEPQHIPDGGFNPIGPERAQEELSGPGNNDYNPSEYQPAYEMPAYQPSLGEEAVTVSLGDIPEAEDVIYMISQIDPELEKSATDSQMLSRMRKESGGGKKGKNKPKLNPLPFDMLVPGVPLVATVYSPSGGVGKSSTAMNLAAYIAAVGQAMAKKEKGSARIPRVLVLDGDIVQGSLAIRLTGELKPSIHTLQIYIDDREAEGFSGDAAWPQHYSSEGAPPMGPGEKTMLDFVHWHKSLPNLNLLAAPEKPDLFWDFGPEEYRFILKQLARFYDVIIIDTGTDLVLDSQRSWLAHANEVFLVTAPENDRLYNASKAVDYMIHEQPHPQDHSENPRKLAPLVTPDKLSVVMTRYDMDSGIDSVKTIDEIFSWLDTSQKFFVPDFSKEMIIANNFGDFLALENAKYAQSIDQLAQRIFHRYVDAKTQRGLPSSF